MAGPRPAGHRLLSPPPGACTPPRPSWPQRCHGTPLSQENSSADGETMRSAFERKLQHRASVPSQRTELCSIPPTVSASQAGGFQNGVAAVFSNCRRFFFRHGNAPSHFLKMNLRRCVRPQAGPATPPPLSLWAQTHPIPQNNPVL